MKKINFAVVALSAITVAGFLTPVFAQEEENPAINYRQKYMSSVGGHFGALRELVSGDVERKGHLEIHAAALAALAGHIPSLFPEDSATGKTAAKSAIWENWDDFLAKADTAQKNTASFKEAVASGDSAAINSAFREVGKACRGCHEDYKQRD